MTPAATDAAARRAFFSRRRASTTTRLAGAEPLPWCAMARAPNRAARGTA